MRSVGGGGGPWGEMQWQILGNPKIQAKSGEILTKLFLKGSEFSAE